MHVQYFGSSARSRAARTCCLMLALLAGLLAFGPASALPALADTTRPTIKSVVIGDGDAVTDRDVTIRINVDDPADVTRMYIEEWHLVRLPAARAWGPVRNSGWIPYQQSYNWTLGDESGVHFILVWVADEARNVSRLNADGADFVSLIKPSDSLEQSDIQVYLAYYKRGQDVRARMTVASGDADLYVWYPANFLLPNQRSNQNGTATEQVSFEAPRDGAYVFVVYGYAASTYSLELTPAGGREAALVAVEAGPEPAQLPIDKFEGLGDLLALASAGLDPLTVAAEPAPPPPTNAQQLKAYLPAVIK